MISEGQICEKALEASRWRKGWPPEIVAADLAARTRRDFPNVAALRKTIDLLGTVDTAVTYSAGALGVPIWMVPSCAANWPWLRVREDSPCDPTLRLFRQASPGDRPTLFTRLAKALQMHIQMEKVPRFDRQRGKRGQVK